MTGGLNNGDQVPIPTGFTDSQCNWIVSQRKDPGMDNEDVHEVQLYVDGDRYVRMYELKSGWDGSGNWINGLRGTANYLVICGANLNIIKN
jgi:hypothetical protein